MKSILVATDLSERSDRAVRRGVLLARRHGAAMTLVHVIDNDQPERILRSERREVEALLQGQAQSLNDIDGVACTSRVLLDDPFVGLTAEVERCSPDLLLLGPHRRQLVRDIFTGTTAERIIRTSHRPVLMANAVPARDYTHVLVAVDLSDSSAAAVRAMIELDLPTGAAVSVLYAFDPAGATMIGRTAMTLAEIKAYEADEQARAQSELDSFLGPFGFRPMHRLVRVNDIGAANVIRAVAGELSADLVVVGTHGRSGIAKLLLGSVADEVLRRAECDVLAVPPQRAG